MHITLGIFLKIFNLLELYCKRIDYRILNVDHTVGDDDVIDQVDFLESYVANLEEALLACTANFNWQVIQLEDDDNEGRDTIESRLNEHTTKVQCEIEKKVS